MHAIAIAFLFLYQLCHAPTLKNRERRKIVKKSSPVITITIHCVANDAMYMNNNGLN